MIHTETLEFTYNNTDFEATVTYNDEPFRNGRSGKLFSIFWDVELHRPEALSCAGAVRQANSISSFMLFKTKAGDRHFIYDSDPAYEEKEDEVNIYARVINKILYCYFNKEKIAHYKQKVNSYEEAIDKKFELKLETLQQQKLTYRKQMKAGEITPKEYQRLYTPIRKEKEALELEMFVKKDAYKRRYFDCCELRSRFRVFKPGDEVSCLGQQIEWCNTSFLKKLNNAL